MPGTGTAISITGDLIASGERLFPPGPGVPAIARKHVRAWLSELGLGKLSGTVTQITSELVANAVIHGHGTEVGLELVYTPAVMIVMVTDGSPEIPVAGTASGSAGKGLAIVAALSTRWGYCPADGGRKIVWSEIEI